MKRKNLEDFKLQSVKELKAKIADFEKNMTKELLELKMGRVKNVHAVRNIKKNIAKLNTLIKMKLVTEITDQKSNKKEKAIVVNKVAGKVKTHATS